jgi:hypothetical protein
MANLANYTADDEPVIPRPIRTEGATMPTPTNPGVAGSAVDWGQIYPQPLS